MTEAQGTEAAARAEPGFAWVGAFVVATTLALVLGAGWLWLLWLVQDALPLAEGTALEDLDGAPIRSLKLGLLIGLVIAAEQVHRMATKERGQWPGTALIALVMTATTSIASLFGEYVRLQAVTATTVFVGFSLLHLFGAVVAWLTPRLARSTMPGLATALTLTAFMPVCGGVAVTDALASLSAPAEKLDGNDIIAGVQHIVRQQCFEAVAGWRPEALRVVKSRAGVTSQDAEDVVSDVTEAVCKSGEPRVDLRAYFFQSIRNRSVDPWRAVARQKKGADIWERPLPLPGPAAILDRARSCEARALASLPEEQRQIVALKEMGFTTDELVTKLGRSRSAVDRSVQAARAAVAAACPQQ